MRATFCRRCLTPGTELWFQLALIADNAKFFLEVLSHRKSEKLEWIIIILISVEVGFAALEHMPPGIFDTVSKFVS